MKGVGLRVEGLQVRREEVREAVLVHGLEFRHGGLGLRVFRFALTALT